MTDLRPRNDDLLYGRDGDTPRGWRVTAIFGTIAAAVTLLVATYLTGSYNPASTGFSAAVRAPAGAEPRSSDPIEPAVTEFRAPVRGHRS